MKRTTSTRFAVSLLVVAAIVGTSAATSAVHRPRVAAAAARATPGARLVAFGGRSAAQQRSGTGAKFDAALAQLARNTTMIRQGTALADLRALNPAAHFMVARDTGTAYVAVDAVTRGDPQVLKAALTKLGMQRVSVYRNDVGGWLPVAALNDAVTLPQLNSVRAAMWRARSGAVTTQGDLAQGSAAARTSTGLTGAGVTVGILSDSYNCYATYAAPGSGVPASGDNGYASNGFTATAATDVASGDLPAGVSVLKEDGEGTGYGTCMGFAPSFLPDSDEGRAMLQVVHDVAPGASLAFRTASNSEADFAQGIQDLADAGAKVIADDVGYFDEPFFQDGIVAQAIDAVNAQGVSYFAAAGNSGTNGYDNTTPVFATASTSPAGEMLLNFDATAATTTTTLNVDIPALVPGEYLAVILQWDQPYVTGAPDSGGATSQMDLCLTSNSNGLVWGPQNPNAPDNGAIGDLGSGTQVCTGKNNTGVDPYQILIIGYPADSTGGACPAGYSANSCSAAQTIKVQVGYVAGPKPGRVKVAIDDNGAGVTYSGAIAATGGTLQGHPSATGAMAVGAVFWYDTINCGDSANRLESYSALGGDPILFDANGAPLATPEMRQKPDIAGPDGGNNTFLGFTIGDYSDAGCVNNQAYPNFFGTSAATPHVAAVAALMLQNNPSLTPSQIFSALRSTSGPLVDSSDAAVPVTGYGFIKAGDAITAAGSGAGGGAVTVNLTLAPTSITLGASAKLTWSSTNASSCASSGDWPNPGNVALSGSIDVTPAATGSYNYTITCINGGTNSGSSALETQTLTVNGSSSGGGGGGALDLAALLLLSGTALARMRRDRAQRI